MEKNKDKNTNEILIVDEESIKNLIYQIRGRKIMLDFDLARIYGYTTSNFNKQVKRNIDKFPEDFRFQLTKDELLDLVMFQNVTSRNNTLKMRLFIILVHQAKMPETK